MVHTYILYTSVLCRSDRGTDCGNPRRPPAKGETTSLLGNGQVRHREGHRHRRQEALRRGVRRIMALRGEKCFLHRRHKYSRIAQQQQRNSASVSLFVSGKHATPHLQGSSHYTCTSNVFSKNWHPFHQKRPATFVVACSSYSLSSRSAPFLFPTPPSPGGVLVAP